MSVSDCSKPLLNGDAAKYEKFLSNCNKGAGIIDVQGYTDSTLELQQPNTGFSLAGFSISASDSIKAINATKLKQGWVSIFDAAENLWPWSRYRSWQPRVFSFGQIVTAYALGPTISR